MSSHGGILTKNGRAVAEFFWEKHPDICAPPMEHPMCVVFEDYKKVPETVPLDFLEENVMWVASSLRR